MKKLRARLHVFGSSFGWRTTLPLTTEELGDRRADIVELMCHDALAEDLGEIRKFYGAMCATSHMRLLCDQQGPLVVATDPFFIGRLADHPALLREVTTQYLEQVSG